MMSRAIRVCDQYARTLKFLTLLCLLSCVTTLDAADQDDRPNILFILTDDQTHKTVSAYEGAWQWSQTPNIDRLAKSGVRFKHAYCGSWCSVSRAMILSGRHLHAMEKPARVRTNDGLAPTWLPALHRSGYTTAAIGKWDLPTRPEGPWDHSVFWNFWHDSQIENGKRVGVKFRGDDYYDGAAYSIDGAAPRVINGYSTDLYTDFAGDFIRRKHDQPWFLWLCYGAPHVPSRPAERHRSLYMDAVPELPSEQEMFGPRENVPRYQQSRSTVTRNGDRIERAYPKGMMMTDLMRECARTVRGIDDNVGRLVELLEKTRQLDRTLIVFISDDGMPYGEHGFINKIGPYDACQRVPFIISGPNVARDATCSHPVEALDLIPTFFSVAKTKPPYELHGHDLSPLLKQPTATWPHSVMLEFFGFHAGKDTHAGVTPYPLAENRPSPLGIPWWISLRKGRFKYIRTLVRDEIEELYDIENDPSEHINLAVQPQHRERLEDFRSALRDELVRTGASTLADNLPTPKVISP